MINTKLRVYVKFQISVTILTSNQNRTRILRVKGNISRMNFLTAVRFDNALGDKSLLFPKPNSTSVLIGISVALTSQCYSILEHLVFTLRKAHTSKVSRIALGTCQNSPSLKSCQVINNTKGLSRFFTNS